MARLPERHVVLVGAGGLGSAAGITIARAFAARDATLRVSIFDGDRVELGNLHRQVIHAGAEPGEPKARSAARAIERLGRDRGVRARAFETRITVDNALEAVRGADVVIDGSDNFATRFLVNDACVLAGVPFVHAAAVRWGGQLLACDPRPSTARGAARGEREVDPCYRCLFEAPPPHAAGTGCAEAGVAGPAVGVVGALAAEAALALLDGRAVGGALHVYDGLAGSFRRVRFRRNRSCLACGERPFTSLDASAYAAADHAECAAP